MDVWESRKTLYRITGKLHQYIQEKLVENKTVYLYMYPYIYCWFYSYIDYIYVLLLQCKGVAEHKLRFFQSHS